ncbi:hypothetical protein HMPREF3138_08450 [Serratia sp. HMSC15F11]|nr:hypothetical protein C7M66_25115 [Serratia marcescens]OFS93391.1 hypothetical protein HMPREF3138_08450 [Serratia sp. HMSC15F11]AXX27348.1 hypothetical protein C7M65_25085 [Serratia marcescens]RTE96650.1 hypothetical protein C7M70_18260 [Serratia marcescens]RTE96711.1 hypothetical protein C7M68_24890 [Serratia marcescens]
MDIIEDNRASSFQAARRSITTALRIIIYIVIMRHRMSCYFPYSFYFFNRNMFKIKNDLVAFYCGIWIFR